MRSSSWFNWSSALKRAALETIAWQELRRAARGAQNCRTRVTGTKLGVAFVDGFFIIIIYTKRYFFQRIFPKLLIIFFCYGRSFGGRETGK